MAGRPRKPTKLKVLEGTFRKDRALENEIQPEVKLPDPPKWLGKKAAEVWEDLAQRFYDLNVLTEIDKYALGMLCQELGRFIDAEEVLNNKGIGSTLHQQKNGNITTSPMLWVSNGALKNAYQLMTAFGMTPAARTKVAQELKDKSNKTMSRWEKIQNLKKNG